MFAKGSRQSQVGERIDVSHIGGVGEKYALVEDSGMSVGILP